MLAIITLLEALMDEQTTGKCNSADVIMSVFSPGVTVAKGCSLGYDKLNFPNELFALVHVVFVIQCQNKRIFPTPCPGGLQSRRSSDRYCSGAMFHPKFISLAQVVPGPIQP